MLGQFFRPNQIGFLKGRNIIDNVYLVFEMMDWVVESNQSIVMLLLDFEKAYDRVKWGFLEGKLATLGFSNQWIDWVKTLYVDSWCLVGVNGTTSEAFKLSRLVWQDCPLAPFLYLFVVDCLSYLLDNTNNV